jgi:regulator of protease activity HflC (stomatin/prohibitin superfamily)
MVAYPWSLYRAPPQTAAQRTWSRFFEHHLPNVSIVLMVMTLVAAVLYPHAVVTVPSGQVGVLWKRFGGGTVLDPTQLRGEGLHIILPWDELFLYDLRLQSNTESYNAISSEGVSLTASTNMRFLLKRHYIPALHQAIGPSYMQLLVKPEIGSRMREVMAEYTAEQIYSTKRQEIQDEIRRRTIENLGKAVQHGVEQARFPLRDALDLYDTLILGIELPTPVVGAINRKTEQFYAVQEYTFRVEREQKESERKQIEANGIHAFQQTVSQGISDSYLRWRGIEATLQLAQSSNTKIVIVGGGKDGLPIILGNVDAAPAASPAGTPATPADGAATKDKPATSPTTPSDKPPVAGTTPSDKTSTAAPTTTDKKAGPSTTDKKSTTAATDKTPASGSTTTTKKDDSTFRWSDIEAVMSRISQALRSAGSDTASKSSSDTSKSSSDKPAAEPPK